MLYDSALDTPTGYHAVSGATAPRQSPRRPSRPRQSRRRRPQAARPPRACPPPRRGLQHAGLTDDAERDHDGEPDGNLDRHGNGNGPDDEHEPDTSTSEAVTTPTESNTASTMEVTSSSVANCVQSGPEVRIASQRALPGRSATSVATAPTTPATERRARITVQAVIGPPGTSPGPRAGRPVLFHLSAPDGVPFAGGGAFRALS
jgi:hypothetical protein